MKKLDVSGVTEESSTVQWSHGFIVLRVQVTHHQSEGEVNNYLTAHIYIYIYMKCMGLRSQVVPKLQNLHKQILEKF